MASILSRPQCVNEAKVMAASSLIPTVYVKSMRTYSDDIVTKTKKEFILFDHHLVIHRVVSRAKDGGIPPKVTTCPPTFVTSGGRSPSICIEGPFFSGQSPPFLRY